MAFLKNLGTKMKDAAATVTSTITGPGGEKDPEFEQQREIFEKHEKHVHNLKKSMEKHLKSMKELCEPIILLSQDISLLYEGERQGEIYAEAAQEVETALKQYLVIFGKALILLENDINKVAQVKKLVADRDKIKSDMDKYQSAVNKGAKEQHKHAENEQKLKVARDVYNDRNPKLIEEIKELWENRVKDLEEKFALICSSQIRLFSTAKEACGKLEKLQTIEPRRKKSF